MSVDEEIRKIKSSLSAKIDVEREIYQLKSRVAQTLTELDSILERLNFLETHVGIDKSSYRVPEKKLINTSIIEEERYVVDLRLIENSDEVPEDYYSVIMLYSDKTGNLVYVHRDDLKELCDQILMNPISSIINFKNFIKTNYIGTMNENSEFQLIDYTIEI